MKLNNSSLFNIFSSNYDNNIYKLVKTKSLSTVLKTFRRHRNTDVYLYCKFSHVPLLSFSVIHYNIANVLYVEATDHPEWSGTSKYGYVMAYLYVTIAQSAAVISNLLPHTTPLKPFMAQRLVIWRTDYLQLFLSVQWNWQNWWISSPFD